MSSRITLAELRSVVDRLVDTDDFTALANRAVKRLYSKSATPGDTELYHFPSTPVDGALHNVNAAGV